LSAGRAARGSAATRRAKDARIAALFSGALLLLALASAAAQDAPATDEAPARALPALPGPAADHTIEDPCAPLADPAARDSLVVEGLDWTRQRLFSSVCVSARWFDRFFGDERFDDVAARGAQGYAYYLAEVREGTPTTHSPGLRVRIALPNLNRRLHFFVDRDEDRQTIAGQSERVDSGPTSPVAPREDSAQFGFGYLVQKARDLFRFRVGVRLKSGELEPFVQGQYQHVFAQTDSTRWRFGETLFWRRTEGAGATTSLDFEAALRKDILFRWFNDATVSESTQLVQWLSGTSLYFDLGNRRAVQVQVTANGDTGEPVDVSNYGARVAYRRTLGPPWLIGEVYVGHDFPKSLPGVERLSQTFGGFRIEMRFGRDDEPAPRPEPGPGPDIAPQPAQDVQR
jgi:hypothetical protein